MTGKKKMFLLTWKSIPESQLVVQQVFDGFKKEKGDFELTMSSKQRWPIITVGGVLQADQQEVGIWDVNIECWYPCRSDVSLAPSLSILRERAEQNVQGTVHKWQVNRTGVARARQVF